MKKIKYLLLASTFMLVAGCAQQAATDQSVTTQPITAATTQEPSQNAGSQTIKILNYAFTPENLTIKTGTTVTWVNNDPVPHKLVVSSGDAQGFGSDNLSNGGTYSYTFTKAGTVNYFCQIHPMMKGTITVTP